MKNIKRLLCICLIACICLCAVGCNKNTDTNSSGLSTAIIQTETSSIDSETKSTEEKTSTEESKVSTEDKNDIVESKTNKEESKTNLSSNISSSSNQQTSSINTTSSNNNTLSSNIETEETTSNNILNVNDWFDETFYNKFVADKEILSQIIDINGSRTLAICKDGSIYECSLKKMFSNGSHFKKIDSDLKFLRFAEADGGIIANNGKVYSGVVDDTTKKTTFIEYKTDQYGSVTDLSNVFEVIHLDGDVGPIINFIYDGNIIKSLDGNLSYKFANDEVIKYAITNTIITNKGYYFIYWFYDKEYADSEETIKLKLEFIKTHPQISFCKAYAINRGWDYVIYNNEFYSTRDL